MKTQIVEVDGLLLEISNEPPKDGEMYIAKRNVGYELLTAKFVDEINRYIVPKEFPNAYVYNICECKKVIKIIE